MAMAGSKNALLLVDDVYKIVCQCVHTIMDVIVIK
jgi:hypothetical protein